MEDFLPRADQSPHGCNLSTIHDPSIHSPCFSHSSLSFHDAQELHLEHHGCHSDVPEFHPSVVNRSRHLVAKGWRCSVGGMLLVEVHILNEQIVVVGIDCSNCSWCGHTIGWCWVGHHSHNYRC